MSDLDELLAAGDPEFLGELDAVLDPKALRRLARRWCADARPEARALLLAYLSRRLHPFHEPLVVRLFRHAWRVKDDEVMGRFLVLLDCSRSPKGRTIGSACVLRLPSGRRVLTLGEDQRRAYEAYQVFSLPTRRLLQRRAWSYFDRLGRERPERYVPALAEALKRYRRKETSGKN